MRKYACIGNFPALKAAKFFDPLRTIQFGTFRRPDEEGLELQDFDPGEVRVVWMLTVTSDETPSISSPTKSQELKNR